MNMRIMLTLNLDRKVLKHLVMQLDDINIQQLQLIICKYNKKKLKQI
ncbi:Uncharacterised protein [Mycobacterium tuberculosis]|nr:Uncharacterised protein [Mycobacterium tuberculosis]